MTDLKNKSKSREKRELRSIAHHLQVIVTVAEQGVSEAVVKETRRALRDHELIKVRLNLMEKSDRKQLAEELAKQCAANLIQLIGKVAVLYKHNPKADPRLSNISRYRLG